MLTSPAFAQSYNAGYGSGNVIDQPALEHGGPTASGNESFASVPPRASARHARNTRTEQVVPSNDPYTGPATLQAATQIRTSGSNCIATTRMTSELKV